MRTVAEVCECQAVLSLLWADDMEVREIRVLSLQSTCRISRVSTLE